MVAGGARGAVEMSMAVANGFAGTGDVAREGSLEDLSFVLDKGVRVAMMYGDRREVSGLRSGIVHRNLPRC